ncbi:magnetosome protein MamEO [Fundidesulfovibrio magnetotacticus]|uniref:Probable membrane transporter protein n=1 Tax=Fundidesulfovibrio magnetotacticus TaxID=2730080 RepID=A0A6V8LHU3_9BACT|nr:TSUP family transporter [Fundidesulfovibrio magnetotacticus]GFK92292.1 magnetosome protein MamEO [Fundidesulfovibrio magnetotacticus]
MSARVFVFLLLAAWLAAASAHAAPGGKPGNLAELQDAITRSVAANKDSVVSVKARKKAATQGGGEIWYESIGTGVVVDERGYILTNSHVVRGGEGILAGFWRQGAQEVAAVIVDEDPQLDLALLRVTPPVDLRKAVFGDSTRLAQGDWVVALGCPLGYEFSASFGIISALQRDLSIDGVAYRNMLQTDADINQGNSGGPLLDLNGRIAGINVAIYSPDNAYTGVGFVIPANKARNFVSQTVGVVSAIPAAQVTPALPAMPAPVLPQVQPNPQRLSAQPDQSVAQLPSAQATPEAPAPATTPQPGGAPGQWTALPAAQTAVAQPQTGAASTPSPTAQDQWTPLPDAQQGPSQSTVQQAPAPAAPLQQAAAQAPAAPAADPAKLLPLDVTKKMPKDATHKDYPPCATCHVVTKKSVVNINKPMPHPQLGSCSTCHDIIQEKVAQGPVTVAWERVIERVPAASWVPASHVSACLWLLLAALAAMAIRLDPGLLGVPTLLLMGYDVVTAIQAGLALSAATGLVAMLRSGVKGMIDLRLIGAVAPLAILFAFAGGIGLRFLPGQTIPMALAAVLMATALLQLSDLRLASALAGKDAGGLAWRKTCDGHEYAVGLGMCALITMPAALAGAMTGTGGVWLFMPLFVTVFRTPMPMAEAASSVLAVCVGLAGLLGASIGTAQPSLPLLGAVACAAATGALAGLVSGTFRHGRAARLCGFTLLVFAALGLTARIMGYL